MNGRLSVDELLDRTKDTIEELFISYGSVAGSIGIVKDGKQYYLNVGKEEEELSFKKVANDHHTVYLISSMTKPILALAVAIMVNDENYGISLNTPVKNVLEELERKTWLRHACRELTLADLLDNRTEFLRCTNLWESPDGYIPWQTMDPIISLLRHLPPSERFKKPEDFVHARNYSNEGFALAAAIIEKKTGMPWTEFVEKKILDPLEMKETFAGMQEWQAPGECKFVSPKMAGSYTVEVDGSLKALRAHVMERKPVYAEVHRHVESKHFCPPQAIGVPRSKAGWARDGSRKSTPIGAAAGIMSSVNDLLTLYARILEVFNRPGDDAVSLSEGKEEEKLNGRQRELQELEWKRGCPMRELDCGIVTMQKHILDMMEDDDTCAYAAGWNTVGLPWNPEQQTGPKRQQRWPGADGDNARRLEKAMKALGKDQKETNRAWRFFQDHNLDSGKLRKFFHNRDGKQQQQERHLALYHGGNMVGATSFCILLPSENAAVVVLSNTRGFFLDAANMTGMLLADCLFRGSFERDVEARCNMAKGMAQHIAASYLKDVSAYEEDLSVCYPEMKYSRKEMETFGKDCSGTYQLTEHIFVEVALVKWGDPMNDLNAGARLEIRLYGRGATYPLRISRGGFAEACDHLSMTFATDMSSLLKTGLGGNNRLDISDFHVTFRTRGDDQFQELVWNFERVPDPENDFLFQDLTFRRVPDRPGKIPWGEHEDDEGC